MRNTASLAIITGLSMLLLGCKDLSKDDLVLVTPKGYPAPTAITRPSWEEKLAFQTGVSPSDAPQVPLALASKDVTPPAPAVAAPAEKRVAARARRGRRVVTKVAHKRRAMRRRNAVLAER